MSPPVKTSDARSRIFLLQPLGEDTGRFFFARDHRIGRFGVGLLVALYQLAILLQERPAHYHDIHRKRGGLHVTHVHEHVHAKARRFANLRELVSNSQMAPFGVIRHPI